MSPGVRASLAMLRPLACQAFFAGQPDVQVPHNCPLACQAFFAGQPDIQVFDVARVLGQLFGVGDGRVIFRASAAAIGAKHLRVPDQSGTRKGRVACTPWASGGARPPRRTIQDAFGQGRPASERPGLRAFRSSPGSPLQ